MILSRTYSIFRAHRGVAVFTAVLGLASLTVLPAACATSPELDPAAVVTSGDTFSIEMVGYDTAAPAGDIYLIQTNLNPTFGTTQTYANDALGNQTLTVTSSESTTAGVTTDTISVGVPTNFVPAGIMDNNGNVINAIEFSIGNYLGATNTLDFSTALTAPITTGSVVYNQTGITVSSGLTQNPVLSNGNKSYSDAEAVQSSSLTSTVTPISTYNTTSFTITITNTAVPEPSAFAMMALGAIGLLGITTRRRAGRA